MAKFNSNNDVSAPEVAIGDPTSTERVNPESTLVQVTVFVPSATVGTIAWEAIARNGDTYEPLTLAGVAYELDVSTGTRTFSIPDKAISALKGTPTGLDGDPWHFKVCATEN